LITVWQKLDPGGLLVVQVPDCEQNPFLFMVADHSLHCFLAPVRELVESVGFAVEHAVNHWVPKELTIVARKGFGENQLRPMRPVQNTARLVLPRIEWLRTLADSARSVVAKGATIGVFGTSIAATWLFAELDGKVSYFVDEDPNRIGRTHMDRPIHSAHQIPAGTELIVPLPLFLARAVSARIPLPVAQVHLPSEIATLENGQ
jgi:hypothetical protein